MKKRLLPVLLATAIALCLLTTVAFAQNATVVYVGGILLNNTNPYLVNGQAAASGTLGENGCTAYFDSSSGTLTLNNANIKTAYDNRDNKMGIYATGDLTIKLVGGNIITGVQTAANCISYGIYVNGSLTIQNGSSDGSVGSLNVSGFSDANQIFSIGIFANTVAISGGNVTATGTSSGICGSNASGTTISGGTVSATGAYGFDSNVTISGGTVTAKSTGTKYAFFSQPILSNDYKYQWRISESGTFNTSAYSYSSSDAYVEIKPVFASVTNITGVPDTATAGTNLPLTGTVAPANATNKTIVWSVSDAGNTGATISGNTLSTTAAGKVTITATIPNGMAGGTIYTQNFDITVSAAPTPTPSPSYGGGFYSPVVTLYNSGSTVWITGSGLSGGNQLITDVLVSGSGYNALKSLVNPQDIIVSYDIHLDSGNVAQGTSAYLNFTVPKEFAGQTFTLLHRKADRSIEYFFAIADSSGNLQFGPISELSPFMLVKGTVVQNVVNPDTGDNTMLGLFAGLAVFSSTGIAAALINTKKNDKHSRR